MSGMDALYAGMDAEWMKAKEAHRAARDAARVARGLKAWGTAGGRVYKRESHADNRKMWKERIAELRAHGNEEGYAYAAAERWGVTVRGIQQRIAHDGFDVKTFGKVFHRRKACQCMTRMVEIPPTKPGLLPRWRCAVNGRECELARTCVLGGLEGTTVNVSGLDVMGFCLFAIGSDFDRAAECGNFDRCNSEWRCWRRENVTEHVLDVMWATERDADRRASSMVVGE